MTTHAPILIAGGGIGGLALSIALARQGRRSVVLEQRPTFSTAGAGIQLGPNGVRVLQRLGVAEALRPMVGVPEAIRVHDGRSGRTLAELPLGDWIAARHGAPYWVAHRGDLHSALLAAATSAREVTLRTGFAVDAYGISADGVRVVNGDRNGAHGAALVGADGLWSTVRRQLHPGCVPIFAGATAMRTVIAADAAGVLRMPAVGVWLTPGVHVVHYPVRGGADIAVVVITAEDWQGREWDAEADAAPLLARLAGFHSGLVDVLAGVRDWRKWALHRLPAPPAWSVGPVTLLGDAAHPMLPYLAQGGVLALEDALVLASCIAAQPGDEPGALQAFERLRRERARRVQRASRRQGRIYHLPPPLSWARDAVLRLAPGARLMAGYDWLYGWGADAQADRAG